MPYETLKCYKIFDTFNTLCTRVAGGTKKITNIRHQTQQQNSESPLDRACLCSQQAGHGLGSAYFLGIAAAQRARVGHIPVVLTWSPANKGAAVSYEALVTW